MGERVIELWEYRNQIPELAFGRRFQMTKARNSRMKAAGVGVSHNKTLMVNEKATKS